MFQSKNCEGPMRYSEVVLLLQIWLARTGTFVLRLLVCTSIAYGLSIANGLSQTTPSPTSPSELATPPPSPPPPVAAPGIYKPPTAQGGDFGTYEKRCGSLVEPPRPPQGTVEDQFNSLKGFRQKVGQAFQNAFKDGENYRKQLEAKLNSNDKNDLKSLQEEIDFAVQDVDCLILKQASVDEDINALLIPDTEKNQFKLWVSIIFSGMVLVVIVGFFTVALTDMRVRGAIFSNQTGIQFVTLFSLVIAIILFGITGILEARELSALLGGISGYILGRVTTDRATGQASNSLPTNGQAGGTKAEVSSATTDQARGATVDAQRAPI